MFCSLLPGSPNHFGGDEGAVKGEGVFSAAPRSGGKRESGRGLRVKPPSLHQFC